MDFGDNGNARLLYPLGSPSGVNEALARASLKSQRAFNSGLRKAIDEVTKSSLEAAFNHSSIVILTDRDFTNYADATKMYPILDDSDRKGIRLAFGTLRGFKLSTAADIGSAFPSTSRALKDSMVEEIEIDEALNTWITNIFINGLTRQEDNPDSINIPYPDEFRILHWNRTGSPAQLRSFVEPGKTVNITVPFMQFEDQYTAVLLDKAGKTLQKGSPDNETGAIKVSYTASTAIEVVLNISAVPGSAPDDTEARVAFLITNSLTCNDTPSQNDDPNTTLSSSPTSRPTGNKSWSNRLAAPMDLYGYVAFGMAALGALIAEEFFL